MAESYETEDGQFCLLLEAEEIDAVRKALENFIDEYEQGRKWAGELKATDPVVVDAFRVLGAL